MRLQKYEKYLEYLTASALFFRKLSENLYGGVFANVGQPKRCLIPSFRLVCFPVLLPIVAVGTRREQPKRWRQSPR